MSAPAASQRRRAWWYACWVIVPLLWLIPSMSVERWPPDYTTIFLDICACSVGVVAAARIVRTNLSAGLRVAAAILGSVYFLYLALGGVLNLVTLVKMQL